MPVENKWQGYSPEAVALAERTCKELKGAAPKPLEVYQVVWTFTVKAASQSEANEKIQQTMSAFAASQGWPQPEVMERLEK